MNTVKSLIRKSNNTKRYPAKTILERIEKIPTVVRIVKELKERNISAYVIDYTYRNVIIYFCDKIEGFVLILDGLTEEESSMVFDVEILNGIERKELDEMFFSVEELVAALDKEIELKENTITNNNIIVTRVIPTTIYLD